MGLRPGARLVTLRTLSFGVGGSLSVAKENIKWKKGLGQELDASPKVRAKCRKTIMAKTPGVDVRLTCQSLTAIGNQGSVKRIIESGVGGRFIQPCLRYFIDADLMSPATLKLVAEEMHRSVNRSRVIDALGMRQGDGLRAAIAVDTMRQKTKKYVGDGGRCLLNSVALKQKRRAIKWSG